MSIPKYTSSQFSPIVTKRSGGWVSFAFSSAEETWAWIKTFQPDLAETIKSFQSVGLTFKLPDLSEMESEFLVREYKQIIWREEGLNSLCNKNSIHTKGELSEIKEI